MIESTYFRVPGQLLFCRNLLTGLPATPAPPLHHGARLAPVMHSYKVYAGSPDHTASKAKLTATASNTQRISLKANRITTASNLVLRAARAIKLASPLHGKSQLHSRHH